MKHERCLCSEIQNVRERLKRFQAQTETLVVMHYKEARLPTNTGRLAKLLLPQSCKTELRGEPSIDNEEACQSDKQNELDLDRAILIYPSAESLELPQHTERFMSEVTKRKKAQLVFPDGSWRQASKMPKRIKGLNCVPAFHLGPGEKKTRYQLRREPKEGGLATFEAIARILGIIEGPKLQNELESFFDRFVEESLATRKGLQKNSPD